MITISKPLASSLASKYLRPFDVRRDLRSVADLVELCFADTMDADGKSYLRRMRSASRNAGLLSLASVAMEWATVPLVGYVWQQDGNLVGNVSLVPYYVKNRRFYLIANVAVHPDYRRRGIARSLTDKAIEHAHRRGAPSVWLHVRQENDAAAQLYRSQGFAERARRTTWICDLEAPQGELPKGVEFTPLRLRDWGEQRAWLQRSYPPEVSWHMPFNIHTLRPDVLGGFMRFVYNMYTKQWALRRGKHLLGAVSWQASAAKANLLWLATPPLVNERVVYALLQYARSSAPTRRTLVLDYPAGQANQAIQAAGFTARQTLIWMSLEFVRS